MTRQTLSSYTLIGQEPNSAADKSAHFWNKMARKYAKNKVSDAQGYARSLARTRDFLKPQDQVLEIGCGTGTTALHHAPLVSQITGTDISSEMVAIANEKAADGKVLNAKFVVAQAENLPFAESSFDVVMAHNLLHLVSDLDQALTSANRVLKSGGVFISKTPSLAEMNGLMRHFVLPIMKRIYNVPSLHIFTTDELHLAIKRAGFTVEHTEFHATKGTDTRPLIVAFKI